ncbi:MAG: nucleotide exchange factor GrpE [Patescibacteria group bacterium]
MSDDDIVVDTEADLGDGETTPEAKLKKLRTERDEARKHATEHLAGWQRAKADYINLERRMRESGGEVKRITIAALVLDILQAYDSLQLAMAHAAGTPSEVGIRATLKQLDDALLAHGVKKIEPKKGDTFDPHTHEPMQTVATDSKEEDNTVDTTLQIGFSIDDMVIRPARVSIYHLN